MLIAKDTQKGVFYIVSILPYKAIATLLLAFIPCIIQNQANAAIPIKIANKDVGGSEVKIYPLAKGLSAAPNQPNDCAEK